MSPEMDRFLYQKQTDGQNCPLQKSTATKGKETLFLRNPVCWQHKKTLSGVCSFSNQTELLSHCCTSFPVILSCRRSGLLPESVHASIIVDMTYILIEYCQIEFSITCGFLKRNDFHTLSCVKLLYYFAINRSVSIANCSLIFPTHHTQCDTPAVQPVPPFAHGYHFLHGKYGWHIPELCL